MNVNKILDSLFEVLFIRSLKSTFSEEIEKIDVESVYLEEHQCSIISDGNDYIIESNFIVDEYERIPKRSLITLLSNKYQKQITLII